MKLNKFNVFNGTAAASILLAVLVVAAEISKPFKAGLGSVFTHHWIAKIVLMTVAFLLIGFMYQKNKLFGIDSEKLAWESTLASIGVIFIFYIIHYFG